MANTIFDLPKVSWSYDNNYNYIMIHDLNKPESSSTKLLPIALLFSDDLDIHYKRAIGSYGNYVIDWGSDILIDNMGYQSLLWNNRKLIDSIGNISLDWNNRYLQDIDENYSVDWQNRQLLKADGSISFDWQNTSLKICKTALFTINQSGTDDPTLTNTIIDEISLVNITLTRNSIGDYSLAFDNTIISSKSIAFGNTVTGQVICYVNPNDIHIRTLDDSGALSDEILSYSKIKVEVYN